MQVSTKRLEDFSLRVTILVPILWTHGGKVWARLWRKTGLSFGIPRPQTLSTRTTALSTAAPQLVAPQSRRPKRFPGVVRSFLRHYNYY